MANGQLTLAQFKERLTALWWLASKSKALHTECLINNFERTFSLKTEKEVIELCKKVFAEKLVESKI